MARQNQTVSKSCMVNTLTEEEMIFQGSPFLFCENQTIVRLYAEMNDLVDGKILQAALDDVMKSADYFRISVDMEADEGKVKENHQPCNVYNGSAQRQIPTETNGYLFYVSFEQRNVFFTWDHFIADGRSGIRFMNELLKAYCNRRYEAQLPQKCLRSDPLYSLEELFTHYHQQRASKRITSVQPIESQSYSTSLIQARKEDLIQYAMQNGVKPFSALMYLVGRAVWEEKEYGDFCSYSFPVDIRKAVERPDALYNCATTFNKEICFQSDALMLQEMDAMVKESLNKESLLCRLAECEKPYYDASQMSLSIETKIRVFFLLQRMARSDFMMSYLGNPLSVEEKGLEQYVRDYYLIPLWSDTITVILEEVSFGDHITLSFVEMIGNKNVANLIAQELEKAGIQVQSVRNL